jgi:transposase
MEIVKQVVGIDISMDSLVVCFGSLTSTQEQTISQACNFSNTAKGHMQLLKWAKKCLLTKNVSVWFVMEATGVYYEKLAFFLSERGYTGRRDAYYRAHLRAPSRR